MTKIWAMNKDLKKQKRNLSKGKDRKEKYIHIYIYIKNTIIIIFNSKKIRKEASPR